MTSFTQTEQRQKLQELLEQKQIIVCYGAGGVGKTTTSAALGVKAALAGRRVLVLTIDPAKRLADTLNISIENADPHPIEAERFEALGADLNGGSLAIWMVQPSIVFDRAIAGIVSEERVQEVFDLSIYQAMRKLVSGMQEYMAGESLYQFFTSGQYDLIILDTPPSRNAVDFLMAPEQLLGFLDSSILKVFVPNGGRFSLFNRARRVLQSVFQNVGGSGFLGQIQVFTSLILDGIDILKDHAKFIQNLLQQDEAGHLLVTSPEPASLDEARYFKTVLKRLNLPLSGLVVNRSLAAHSEQSIQQYMDEINTDEELILTEELHQALEQLRPFEQSEHKTAEEHRTLLTNLRKELDEATLLFASPHLGRDIDDLDGLLRLSKNM